MKNGNEVLNMMRSSRDQSHFFSLDDYMLWALLIVFITFGLQFVGSSRLTVVAVEQSQTYSIMKKISHINVLIVIHGCDFSSYIHFHEQLENRSSVHYDTCLIQCLHKNCILLLYIFSLYPFDIIYCVSPVASPEIWGVFSTHLQTPSAGP